MKINRSVGSVLEFQQNEPQNQQKIVTPVNNKVAAISKMMESMESKFLTLQKQWWAIVIFVLNSLIYCQTL